jgi:prepilin-type N-terminal cleavage/methylation domain-containing protein
MKRPLKHKHFTMVEMLVVIAIIGILIGMGTAGYKITWKKIKESRTKAAIAKMKLAIESFKTKNGYYPQGATYCVTVTSIKDATDTNSNDFEAIIIPSDNTDKLAKILNLAELKENHGDTYSSNLVLVDAYPCIFGGKKMRGRPIIYIFPGATNTTSFDLYSAGPDGIPDNDDDIWPEKL